ncbi:MAG: alpha/beta hydrolase [Aquincola sp.]|nr:alpha/beta hydrolase [Aquincola sp.]MDH5330931.1 alpha/beta hydrolase [Aquincola sp.]
MSAAYVPRRPARSHHVPVRGLSYHCLVWGEPSQASTDRPLLVLTHGWMDVGASFQFVVDALAAIEGDARCIVAPDWRGFGGSMVPEGRDSYWFPDYLGDLDALIDALSPDAPVDLAGHSMGGNVVMSYAGVRPARVRRLVNLEGFGLPATQPHHTLKRIAQWLDELKVPIHLHPYADADAVAARLHKNNPRLTPDKAAWLAMQWAEPRADGRWHLRADPAHKRVNPVLYRVDEVIATWQAIRAPLLWIEGADTDVAKWWGDRYPRAEFESRLSVVPALTRVRLDDCGHMLHHDQPERMAAHLRQFLVA